MYLYASVIGLGYNTFLPARIRSRGNSYGNVAGWMHGWLSSCHSRCCRPIKTTKPILKLFRPSDSPIIEAFGTTCADTKFQGNPFSEDVNYTGGGKIGDFRAIFDGHRRLSRKRCEIGRWLLWNVNRKSWVPDWMV